MTKNEARGIVTLTAETQQILCTALRQIEFAAEPMMARLPKGNLKELRGGTQLLPQLSCTGKDTARFRRRLAFYGCQDRAQGTQKFEFLSLTLGSSGNSASWSSAF